MSEYNYLEEPPPPSRPPVYQPEPRRKLGLFAARPARPSSSAPAVRDSGGATQRSSGKGILLSLAVLVVLGVQGWLLHGARRDLAALRKGLELTHGSLGLVWESSKKIDQDWTGQLAQLNDSIRSMRDYTQIAVQQRLEENERAVNTRLEDFTRGEQLRLARFDALERQDRVHSSAFEALLRRAQAQETSTRDASATVASMRATLNRMDATLLSMEQRTSTYGQLSRRVENVLGWAEGFRQSGLSAETVQGRLSGISDELRRLRVRVDSLRPVGRAVTTSDIR
jgi:hypothetical protein